MKELKEAIMKWGTVPCDGVVKVDNFLNHRIDSGLMMRMGKELADAFRMQSPDLVLTVEASGIALALAAAVALGEIPVVFAKKARRWCRTMTWPKPGSFPSPGSRKWPSGWKRTISRKGPGC